MADNGDRSKKQKISSHISKEVIASISRSGSDPSLHPCPGFCHCCV